MFVCKHPVRDGTVPLKTVWTPDLDARLRDLMVRQRVSLRTAEIEMGVSRTVLGNRAAELGMREVKAETGRAVMRTGSLQAGHPITWGALSELLCPDNRSAFPLPVFA